MMPLTLIRRQDPLADAAEQLRVLDDMTELPPFERVFHRHFAAPLTARGVEILQVNVGKVCNQTCRHCHVDAGPERRENMSRDVAEACMELLRRSSIATLDITGGAPEMNAQFRWLVTEARRLGRRVIDRSNLTILVAPGFDDLPQFLAAHEVHIVASLPCYLAENVDRQRGDGVFEKSLEALRRLNGLGYGRPGSPLMLTLVFNPQGPSLPPAQSQLEDDYRRELRARYGIEFTRLYTITNMPISRFLDDLLDTGRLENYMRVLVDAFNPSAAGNVMCRTMLSVDWRGRLYDCDFNQMLELGLADGQPDTVFQLDGDAVTELVQRPIVTRRHCFGCTAGAGSSCQGSISENEVVRASF